MSEPKFTPGAWMSEAYDELNRSTELLKDTLKFFNPCDGHGRCIQEQIEANEKVLKKARAE